MEPNDAAVLVARAFGAFAGDIEEARRFFVPEFSWHIPGSSRWAGSTTGFEAVRDMWRRIVDETGGSYVGKPVDFLGGREYAAAIVDVTAARHGRSLAIRQTVIFTLQDGRLSSARQIPHDVAAWDAFFR